jgi:hypothetical protein
MKPLTMTLLQRIKKNEKELAKVRGCTPLTHGWQTQKFAKASLKWDYYAGIKRKLMEEKETRICKCEKPVPDSEYADMCGLCGDAMPEDLEQKYGEDLYCRACLAMHEEECACSENDEE